MSLRPQGDETLSSVYVDDYKMAGKAENVSKMWARLGKRFDLEPPVPFHNTVYLGCQQTNITIPEQIVKDRAALMSKILDKHNQTPSAQTDKSATTESPVRGGKSNLFSGEISKSGTSQSMAVFHERACAAMCGTICRTLWKARAIAETSEHTVHRRPHDSCSGVY